MGGGGAPPGQLATYPTAVTAWHTDAVGTDSLTVGFDLVSALNEARLHNPWTGRDPYDPASTMSGLKTALDNFTDNVENLDSGVDVHTYVDASTAKFDAAINSPAALDALVAAEDAATEAAFQRRVSSIALVPMWMQGSFMTTQFAPAGFFIAAERGHDLAKFRAQLEVANMQMRVNAILDMTRQMIQVDLASIQSQQGAFAAAADYAKMKITATDDYIGQLAEFELKRRTWDFNLLNDGTAMVMSILGTQLTPRALTKSERLASAIGIGINTGLQFGATAGPGAGVLAGAFSLGISALQGAFDAK